MCLMWFIFSLLIHVKLETLSKTHSFIVFKGSFSLSKKSAGNFPGNNSFVIFERYYEF